MISRAASDEGMESPGRGPQPNGVFHAKGK